MALPSKTFVIMAAGAALLSLVDQTSDIAKAIRDNDLGYTLEHGDAKKLAMTILEAYDRKDHLAAQGDNARKWSISNASRKTQTKKYYEALERIYAETMTL